MIACTLLTLALCADPNSSGTVTIEDLSVPVVWSHENLRSCLDVSLRTTGEGGLTHIEAAWRSEQTAGDDPGFRGRLVVRLADVRIAMTAFSWDRETASDEAALRRLYTAVLWHELGHVRTALATVDALNAEPVFSAPTAAEYTALANRHGKAAEARIDADQIAYDRAADHGLRQAALRPPLAGPNTVIECGSGRGRGR